MLTMLEELIEKRRAALQAYFDQRPRQLLAICKRAGVAESAVRGFLSGRSASLQMDTYDKLAFSEKVPVLHLLGEEAPRVNRSSSVYTRRAAESRGHSIPEIEVRAGMGPGQLPAQVEHPKEMWEAPQGFFGRSADLIILEVDGDSMLPVLEPGDRVVVHTADRIPSPAGIFAIFDGHGIMVKHVSTVPQSKPMRINVRSSNNVYPPEEWTVDEDTIVGRVKGFVRRF